MDWGTSAPGGPARPRRGLAGHRAIVNILDVFRPFFTSPDVSGSVAIMKNSAHSPSPAVEPPPPEGPEQTPQAPDRPGDTPFASSQADAAHASSADSFLTLSDPVYDPAAIEARWQASGLQRPALAAPPPQDERTPAYVFAGCPFT